jgi:hypothetical protein
MRSGFIPHKILSGGHNKNNNLVRTRRTLAVGSGGEGEGYLKGFGEEP